MKIEKDKVVTFDCILKDGKGNILEDTKEQGTSCYLHGYGNFLPALEAALEGKEPGDTVKTFIKMEDAFGEYDDTLVVSFHIEEFGEDKPEVGQQILMPSDDDSEEEIVFEVVEIKDGQVKLDGNHPYADLDLDFDIKILDVRDATPEEIERGDIEYECDCGCDDCHDDGCDCGHCH
ncbi:MAG: peptidylprolyl isomerase [Spirochaetia bacterium]|nr:peptidylprolyl isomerase [Spirochaetia bacterium]